MNSRYQTPPRIWMQGGLQGNDDFQSALSERFAGQSVAALERISRLLEQQPGHIDGWWLRAACELDLGRQEDSISSLERLLELDPGHGSALAMWAKVEQPGIEDTNWLDRLERAIREAKDDGHRAAAGFALGALLHRSGKHQQAFAAFQEANSLREVQRPFDSGAYQGAVYGMLASYPSLPEPTDTMSDPGEDLVFILGMPRSGSTLCEQVLAAHPGIVARGELNAMERIERGMLEAGLNLAEAPSNALDYARKLYRTAFPVSPGVLQTDKALFNFERLPLVHLLFPRARFIHCRRDPLDTVLSCYFHDFSSGHDYSFSLEETAKVYVAHERLMAHWKALIPTAFLDVDYHLLVSDTKSLVGQMCEFLGLDPDERMLQPESVERSVNTASALQVREPIHSRGLETWKHYESELSAVRQIFDSEGIL